MGKRQTKPPRTSKELRPLATALIKKCDISSPPVPMDVIAKALGATLRFAPSMASWQECWFAMRTTTEW